MRTFSSPPLGAKSTSTNPRPWPGSLGPAGDREIGADGGDGGDVADVHHQHLHRHRQGRHAVAPGHPPGHSDPSPARVSWSPAVTPRWRPDEIEQIDGVDYIVGHRDKSRIPEMIDALSTEGRGRQPPGKRAPPPSASAGGRTRPFLKIQDGCNAFCTYCIVPHARGKSRSLPLENVL